MSTASPTSYSTLLLRRLSNAAFSCYRKTASWIAKMRPTWLLGDNQSAIFTSNNPETSQRSKHLEIRWFRIRDYVQQHSLQVRHIRTGDNIADFFTKALQGPESFERFRRYLMGDQDFTMQVHI